MLKHTDTSGKNVSNGRRSIQLSHSIAAKAVMCVREREREREQPTFELTYLDGGMRTAEGALLIRYLALFKKCGAIFAGGAYVFSIMGFPWFSDIFLFKKSRGANFQGISGKKFPTGAISIKSWWHAVMQERAADFRTDLFRRGVWEDTN